MLQIIEKIKKSYSNQDPTFASLKELIKGIDVNELNYQDHLPEITSTDEYSRNILQLEPIECVLLHWPAGVESAIHYHAGFWGYVLVIDGACDNVEYQLKGCTLTESRTIRALKGGIINEPDGTIHKIVNARNDRSLVTIHFYYPALENLDNLTLYGEDGRLGVLNSIAKTASFNEPKENFKILRQNAIEVIPFKESKNAKSHHIYPIIPKPDKEQINQMISNYYSEQADRYDLFDFNHPTRKNYTSKINDLIAEDIEQRDQMESMLTLACGTGRRAAKIKEKTTHNYQITGVDLCGEMCEIAEGRGLDTVADDWLAAELGNKTYDVCTFLYAFGHMTSTTDRMASLKKIAIHLKPGGAVFIDVFNINDKHEWGSHALKTYQQLDLGDWGYEPGDVFYKKTDGQEIAFLHYFDEDSLYKLFNEAGLEIEYIKHIGYVYRSGEILQNKDEGSLFVKAVKK